jgi:DNA-binding GntR family transcriptional regulator
MTFDFRIRDEERVPLRERVYQRIREAVVMGRFQPGEQILEEELARLLGVSRTPVREALQRLEAEGHLTIVPRKGIVFGPIISKVEFEQVSQVREALEGLAAALAADSISEADLERLQEVIGQSRSALEQGDMDGLRQLNTLFHQIIIQASRNDRLTRILETMRDEIQRYRSFSSAIIRSQPGQLQDHHEILSALRARDSGAARDAMVKHLQRNRLIVLEAVKEDPTPSEASI